MSGQRRAGGNSLQAQVLTAVAGLLAALIAGAGVALLQKIEHLSSKATFLEHRTSDLTRQGDALSQKAESNSQKAARLRAELDRLDNEPAPTVVRTKVVQAPPASAKPPKLRPPVHRIPRPVTGRPAPVQTPVQAPKASPGLPTLPPGLLPKG